MSEGFRMMGFIDLDRVIEIERRNYDFPWTRGNFADSIESGYCCLVMERSGFVAGYGVMMQVLDEAHLLNLSVAVNWQGMGMGKKLLMHFIDTAKGMGMNSFHLEVRPSNSVALNLYRRAGFSEIAVRPDYYPAEKGREDAVLMRMDL